MKGKCLWTIPAVIVHPLLRLCIYNSFTTIMNLTPTTNTLLSALPTFISRQQISYFLFVWKETVKNSLVPNSKPIFFFIPAAKYYEYQWKQININSSRRSKMTARINPIIYYTNVSCEILFQCDEEGKKINRNFDLYYKWYLLEKKFNFTISCTDFFRWSLVKQAKNLLICKKKYQYW